MSIAASQTQYSSGYEAHIGFKSTQHHHLNRVSNRVTIKTEIKVQNGHETYYGWHAYAHLLFHPSQKLGCQPATTKKPLTCSEWYQNYNRKILKGTKPITIEAKNNVAETVVAPFPLVATWRKTLRHYMEEKSVHALIDRNAWKVNNVLVYILKASL